MEQCRKCQTEFDPSSALNGGLFGSCSRCLRETQQEKIRASYPIKGYTISADAKLIAFHWVAPFFVYLAPTTPTMTTEVVYFDTETADEHPLAKPEDQSRQPDPPNPRESL